MLLNYHSFYDDDLKAIPTIQTKHMNTTLKHFQIRHIRTGDCLRAYIMVLQSCSS